MYGKSDLVHTDKRKAGVVKRIKVTKITVVSCIIWSMGSSVLKSRPLA